MALPPFRGRAFVAMLMLFGFAILTTTGVALYVSPTGRVARDTGWSFLALDKFQWRDMHMSFALMFLIAAMVHAWLNVKPLKNYIRQKLAAQAAITHRWRIEPVIALALCALLGVSTIMGFFPSSALSDARERIARHWEESTK